MTRSVVILAAREHRPPYKKDQQPERQPGFQQYQPHSIVSNLIQRASLTSLLFVATLMVSACATRKAPPPEPVVVPVPAPAPVSVPVPAPAARPAEHLRRAAFSDLPGWADDDVRAAWPAMLASCAALSGKAGWQEACADIGKIDASNPGAVREFFQSRFVPHQVRNPDGTVTGTVTGYYEPLLRGARARRGPFQTPLHMPPPDLVTVELAALYPELKSLRLRGKVVGNRLVPYPSRAEMERQNLLAGRELLWVDDPVDAFFLQVQGSGRVRLDDTGEVVRVAYADQNGHPYRSIGRYLVERGELTLEQASMQGIKAWVAANPARLQELLGANPSYVFFREEKLIDPAQGPRGALGVPLTPQRSIAIDPQFIPLGAPVFLATTLPNSSAVLRRLVLAQDTGGAIRNPVRADFFWGFGPEAGEMAGRMKQSGQMWVLLPLALSGQ